MAKELPYFQFEPAEYLTKDISFCSLSAQGLFINICAYYWQRQCVLTKEQFLRRFNHETEFKELVSEGIIDLIDNKITIKFLDKQLEKAINVSKKNSGNGSKGGRPKTQIKAKLNPAQNPLESQTKGIKENNIKEEENKEKNIIKESQNDIFFSELINSESWIEISAMQSKAKFKPLEVKEKLKEYNTMLELTFDIKTNKNEYATHFIHWLNKQEKPKENKKPFYDSPA